MFNEFANLINADMCHCAERAADISESIEMHSLIYIWSVLIASDNSPA